MARKLQNKHLFLIFIALLIVVGAIQYWQSTQDPDTFESRLIQVDSASVNKLVMQPEFDPEQEVVVQKREGTWKVKDSAEWKDVDQTRLRRTFDQLKDFRASHLVSKEKSEWKEYEVDSSGTLVKIFQNGNVQGELVLGKMKFQNQNMAINYVRKLGGSTIYAVEGYLQASLKGDRKSWIKGEGGRQRPGRRAAPTQMSPGMGR